MPLVHIALRAGKPPAYRQALCDGVYRALQETFDVPEDDQFMAITEHEAANFRYGTAYLGVARSDGLVFIQITASATRTAAQKKALYRRIAERLGEQPGLRPGDVFVNLVEVARENWSLGHGLAQYAQEFR
jgi:4-oxalocrotonate tautomerase